MTMKSDIVAAIRESDQPVTSEAIIEAVHGRSGIHWKGSSIRKALGVLVTRGQVANLCRNPETGAHTTSPCTYGIPS